jgi:hypothetical protein
MSNLPPEEEQNAAENRIDSIRHGSGAAQQPPAPAPRARVEPPARGRVSASSVSSGPADTGMNRNRALMMIGGLVGVGILIVVVIVLLSGMGGGGGVGSFFATDTPTPTPTSTSTATPTITPTPTATPTPPNFTIPGLSCLFDNSVTCFDYCNQTVNTTECNAAKEAISRQQLDANAWWQCVAPGPGVEGNALECARKVWYASLSPGGGSTPSVGTTPSATP